MKRKRLVATLCAAVLVLLCAAGVFAVAMGYSGSYTAVEDGKTTRRVLPMIFYGRAECITIVDYWFPDGTISLSEQEVIALLGGIDAVTGRLGLGGERLVGSVDIYSITETWTIRTRIGENINMDISSSGSTGHYSFAYQGDITNKVDGVEVEAGYFYYGEDLKHYIAFEKDGWGYAIDVDGDRRETRETIARMVDWLLREDGLDPTQIIAIVEQWNAENNLQTEE